MDHVITGPRIDSDGLRRIFRFAASGFVWSPSRQSSPVGERGVLRDCAGNHRGDDRCDAVDSNVRAASRMEARSCESPPIPLSGAVELSGPGIYGVSGGGGVDSNKRRYAAVPVLGSVTSMISRPVSGSSPTFIATTPSSDQSTKFVLH